MSTPEGKVKEWMDRKMKEWFPDSIKYGPPGGMYGGRSGWPDRLYFIPGGTDITIVVAIEAKVPGNTATPLQMKTLRDLARTKAICAVVTGKDIDHMERIRAEVIRRMEVASGLR